MSSSPKLSAQPEIAGELEIVPDRTLRIGPPHGERGTDNVLPADAGLKILQGEQKIGLGQNEIGPVVIPGEEATEGDFGARLGLLVAPATPLVVSSALLRISRQGLTVFETRPTGEFAGETLAVDGLFYPFLLDEVAYEAAAAFLHAGNSLTFVIELERPASALLSGGATGTIVLFQSRPETGELASQRS